MAVGNKTQNKIKLSSNGGTIIKENLKNDFTLLIFRNLNKERCEYYIYGNKM